MVVTIWGELTLTRLLRLRAAWREEWVREPVRASVGDFREAVMKLSGADRDRSFQTAMRWIYKGSAPAATVCSPQDFEDFQADSVRWAQHGYIRPTFTSLTAALAWAQSPLRVPPSVLHL